jgi:hypothetical protein
MAGLKYSGASKKPFKRIESSNFETSARNR